MQGHDFCRTPSRIDAWIEEQVCKLRSTHTKRGVAARRSQAYVCIVCVYIFGGFFAWGGKIVISMMLLLASDGIL